MQGSPPAAAECPLPVSSQPTPSQDLSLTQAEDPDLKPQTGAQPATEVDPLG